MPRTSYYDYDSTVVPEIHRMWPSMRFGIDRYSISVSQSRAVHVVHVQNLLASVHFSSARSKHVKTTGRSFAGFTCQEVSHFFK